MGGYFTRHGQRSGATRATVRLLRQLYQGLRGLRGEHRWVLQLAEESVQSHQRPEFLYSHLQQRFPHKNPERQRRWIKRLRRRALLAELRQQQSTADGGAPAAPAAGVTPGRRLRSSTADGTLSLDSVLQLPRLALLRHPQLQLWWETPQPLLTATRYLGLRRRLRRASHRWPAAAAGLRRRRR